ncbi:MAG: NAD(P)/FAD-dependent oxidoreductase, partial [Desulfobacterales bacterium]|nr:NAD(P)/FAD-dependent oxidoreductase [Desulfobacterales bacterium]
MAHIVVIGGGIGGLPTAFELRRLLPSRHRITLISNSPRFTFIPSLPWVALGLTPLEKIQADVAKILERREIRWIHDAVVKIDPFRREILLGSGAVVYDMVVAATGVSLDMDATPGLGPDKGYTQSVCTPPHALKALDAWKRFMRNPGPLVVGAVPGA